MSDPVFANPEGSYLPIRRGHNSEGSCFCQSGRVIFCQSRGAQFRRGPLFCQSRRVRICQSEGVRIRRVLYFNTPEGFQFGEVPFLPIRKGRNLLIWRGPVFCPIGWVQFGGVLFSQIGGVFLANLEGPNSEGSCTLPKWRGPFLPIRRDPNSERSCFCQSGRVIFCPSGGVTIGRGLVFGNPEGSHLTIPEGSQSERPVFDSPERSQFGEVPFLPIRKGRFLPIWRDPVFLPIRRGPNSDGS